MATRHRLGDHFIIEEVDCRDGTKVQKGEYEDFERAIAWWLEPLRDRFGPVHIVSGYRTHAHNAAVGGATHSVHLLETKLPSAERSGQIAVATDIVCRAGTPRQWASWATQHRLQSPHLAKKGRGGIGLYGGFVHLDTGPLRDWTG